MDAQPSFEQALESDMHQLAAEISAQREQREMKDATEKELVKEAIRSFPGVHKDEEVLKAEVFPQKMTAGSSPLPAYAQTAAPEVKLEIEYLLDVALNKGLGAALAESKKSPDFVQDAFHDTLVGKLYPILQQKGIVK
jgi:hypothetical protein